jgi:hypothetical protein
MGKVADKVRAIMVQENLSAVEVFEKYPHLTELHKEEMFEEHEKDKTSSVKESTYKREILKG